MAQSEVSARRAFKRGQSEAPPSIISVLFSDESLVAVNKPSGIPTIPGRDEAVSIVELLAAELNLAGSGDTDPRLRIVHRLDRDTSGVLLFAKNKLAQRHLSEQFQYNKIAKEYLAIIRGRPSESHGTIDAPLGPHPTSRTRMTVLRHGGRVARTDWRIEEQFRGFALMRCFPKTGRTHQIRVHLAHIGLPLAIDPLYGSAATIFLSDFKRDYRKSRGKDERPLIDRLTLHAHRLAFENLDGKTIALEAELPKDFRATLNMLRKYAR